MSHACTSILMGVAILVSKILLLSKTAKFPFLTMDSVVVNYIRCRYSFSILKSALRCLHGSRSKPHHIDFVDFCRVISDARLGSF